MHKCLHCKRNCLQVTLGNQQWLEEEQPQKYVTWPNMNAHEFESTADLITSVFSVLQRHTHYPPPRTGFSYMKNEDYCNWYLQFVKTICKWIYLHGCGTIWNCRAMLNSHIGGSVCHFSLVHGGMKRKPTSVQPPPPILTPLLHQSLNFSYMTDLCATLTTVQTHNNWRKNILHSLDTFKL